MPTIQEIFASSYANETKVAAQALSSQVQQNDYTPSSASEEELLKVATELGLYKDLFPEDSELNAPQGNFKTAEEEKLAAYEEALGARSHDFFELRFDQRITKIANDLLAESGVIQGRPVQSVEGDNNPALDAAPRVPGASPYSIQAGAEAGAEGQVGHEQQVGQEEQKMAACVRKHFLLSNMK